MAREYDVPTTETLDRMYEDLKNWGRWGADDERGALNHMTDEHRRRAAALVDVASRSAWPMTWPPSRFPNTRTRSSTTCSPRAMPATRTGSRATRRHAITWRSTCTASTRLMSTRFRTCSCGGRCSAAGRPVRCAATGPAPTRCSPWPTASSAGASSSTSLVPSGRTSSDPGEVVSVADLEAAEAAQHVRVGEGDVLVVAWGREARREANKAFDGFSGLHAECLPWLQERGVAVLGSDGISDPMPFVGTPQWPFPVHQIGITAMGLHLIDNVATARLSERCAALDRWEFLFTMGPLRIVRGTGCPVNPVAVL